jgi:transcriptional regulator with GAF, ATPase, and Fis domain
VNSSSDPTSERILGKSSAIQAVFELIDRVAKTSATVLITGESGTGKELVTREIHTRSNRHKQPLVPVNCAAIPANLLEAELIGYEKGAFTDAHINKKGLFEIADSGTVCSTPCIKQKNRHYNASARFRAIVCC